MCSCFSRGVCFVVCCLLSRVRLRLLVACCLLVFDLCWLFGLAVCVLVGDCGSLFVVCCLLFGCACYFFVRCVLLDVCCLLWRVSMCVCRSLLFAFVFIACW